MLKKCITRLKSLLAIVLALNLVLMGQPVEALAADVTYKVTCTSAGNGKVIASYDDSGNELNWYEAGEVWNAQIDSGAVVDLKKLRDPDKVEPENGYVLDHWIADKDLYINGGWGFIGHATTVSKGSTLNASLSGYYVYAYEDLNLTAYFKRKPATVTYTTDGGGTVNKTSESVEVDKEYASGDKTLPVGKPSGTTATPSDSTKYAFDYWTANQDIYKLEDDKLVTVDAGTELDSIADYYVSGDVTFTAYFKQIALTITYTSAGNGSAGKDSALAEFCETGTLPDGGTSINLAQSNHVMANPAENYEFTYWKASKDVYTRDATGKLTVHPAGEELTSTTWLVSEDITFTAYFNHKPVTVTYTTDGNGTVNKTSESVEVDKEYASGDKTLPVGKPSGTTANPYDSTKYAFDHWTADKNVYKYENEQLTTVVAGTELTSPADYYVTEDVKFTAHFKHNPVAITYTTDGNGTVNKTSESVEVDKEYASGDETLPVGKLGGTTATPSDSTKFAFDYWTANQDIYKLEDDKLTTITADTELASTEGYYVTGDVTFTAHFKQIATTISYLSAGHGTVNVASALVVFTETATLPDSGTSIKLAQSLQVDTNPEQNYEFDFWEANKDVYERNSETGDLTVYAAGQKLTSSTLLVSDNTTFTAHFKHNPVTITYATDGNGTVNKTSESVEVDKEYASGDKTLPVGKPSGTTATPYDSTKYAFDYWTANQDIYKLEDDKLVTVDAGTEFDSIADYYVSGDVTFTAHFKQTSSKTDDSDDTDDSKDTDADSDDSKDADADSKDTDDSTDTVDDSKDTNDSSDVTNGDPYDTNDVSDNADSTNDTGDAGDSNTTSSANGSSDTSNSSGNIAPATGDSQSGAAVIFFVCSCIAATLAAFFRRRNY